MTHVQVTLLGPQRRPTVDQVTRTMDPDARLATVTAGWQERETDDSELNEVLGRPSSNLRLDARWLDVMERDRDFAAAEREHRAVLDELRMAHLVQLQSALDVMHALMRRTGDRLRVHDAALADAQMVVRIVDEAHLARVRAAHADFATAWSPQDRPLIAEHRGQVRQLLEGSAGLVVAGGHVGVLVQVMRLFAVASSVPQVVVAWSAGAMALTQQVVLFHDRAPHGPAPAEIYDDGLGVVVDMVLLPHARRRLRVDDPVRMAGLARRFAPARCVVLDDGVMLQLGPDGGLPQGARVVDADGRIVVLEAS